MHSYVDAPGRPPGRIDFRRPEGRGAGRPGGREHAHRDRHALRLRRAGEGGGVRPRARLPAPHLAHERGEVARAAAADRDAPRESGVR